MYKYILTLLALVTLSLTACQESAAKKVNSTTATTNAAAPSNEASSYNSAEAPVMTFDKTSHDFGTIKAGEKVSYSFRFVNKGGRDLIIQSASGSCGCTVPDFPKEPIPPGREGYIRVMFNSEGKSGMQEKQVTVLANTMPNTITVRVKAEIVQP